LKALASQRLQLFYTYFVKDANVDFWEHLGDREKNDIEEGLGDLKKNKVKPVANVLAKYAQN